MDSGCKVGALRILVADADHASADAMATLFQWWGHETHLAYEGELALQQAMLVTPDLAILGISLPHINGLGLVRRLRRLPNFEATRFVALADLQDAEQIEHDKRAGFGDFLFKPVAPLELLDILVKARDARARFEQRHGDSRGSARRSRRRTLPQRIDATEELKSPHEKEARPDNASVTGAENATD